MTGRTASCASNEEAHPPSTADAHAPANATNSSRSSPSKTQPPSGAPSKKHAATRPRTPMRATTPQQEEQTARKQQHNLERARQAAAHKRDQDWRTRLHEKARELRPKHPTCRCDLTHVHTRADLQALGGGCTMPRWTCPFLAVLRRTTDPNPGTSPR